jgi:hypothetical protein
VRGRFDVLGVVPKSLNGRSVSHDPAARPSLDKWVVFQPPEGKVRRKESTMKRASFVLARLGIFGLLLAVHAGTSSSAHSSASSTSQSPKTSVIRVADWPSEARNAS